MWDKEFEKALKVALWQGLFSDPSKVSKEISCRSGKKYVLKDSEGKVLARIHENLFKIYDVKADGKSLNELLFNKALEIAISKGHIKDSKDVDPLSSGQQGGVYRLLSSDGKVLARIGMRLLRKFSKRKSNPWSLLAICCVPVGLISCTASSFVEHPRPSVELSLGPTVSSNGLKYLDSESKHPFISSEVKAQVFKKGRPEFCTLKKLWQEPVYYLTCSHPEKSKKNITLYSSIRCGLPQSPQSKSIFLPRKGSTCRHFKSEFSESKSAKYIRFFGDGEPLASELRTIQLKEWLATVGIFIFFIPPSIFFLGIVINIVKRLISVFQRLYVAIKKLRSKR